MIEALPELLDMGAIVTRVMPCNKRTVHRLIAAGKFPVADVRLNDKMVLWRRETIETWLANPERWKASVATSSATPETQKPRRQHRQGGSEIDFASSRRGNSTETQESLTESSRG